MTLSRPLRVLIADDSTAVSEMLVELISEPGRIEVIGVADSEATAVEKVMHLNPDVIILDMQLRVGHGMGVIRTVRSSTQLRHIKLIVMSNYTSPQVRQRCLEAGADHFFDKSKDFDLLVAALGAYRE